VRVTQILETALYAEDLDAAERFYVQVIGLQVYKSQPPRHVFFRCGEVMLLVFNPVVTLAESSFTDDGKPLPSHGTRGAGHVAFRVNERELPSWREHLKAMNVGIDQDMVWPSGARSIFFRDPAGNHLELATPAVWCMPEREDAMTEGR
jgi:catechol 2,3-dioxygenase-like lactoylglutathione lyase family enzyme